MLQHILTSLVLGNLKLHEPANHNAQQGRGAILPGIHRHLLDMGEGPTSLSRNVLSHVVCVHFAKDYLGTLYKNMRFVFGSGDHLPGLYKVFRMVVIG